jgi:hypothetical protein
MKKGKWLFLCRSFYYISKGIYAAGRERPTAAKAIKKNIL